MGRVLIHSLLVLAALALFAAPTGILADRTAFAEIRTDFLFSLSLLSAGCLGMLMFAHRRGEESADASAPSWVKFAPPPLFIGALLLAAEAAGLPSLREWPAHGEKNFLAVIRHAIVPFFALSMVGAAAYQIGRRPPAPDAPGSRWRIESSGASALAGMAGWLCVIEPLCGWPGLGRRIARQTFEGDLRTVLLGTFLLAGAVTALHAIGAIAHLLVEGAWRRDLPGFEYAEGAPAEMGGDQRRSLRSIRGSRRFRLAWTLAAALGVLLLFFGIGSLPPDGILLGQLSPAEGPGLWAPFGSDAFGRNIFAGSLRATGISVLLAIVVAIGAVGATALPGAVLAAVAGRWIRRETWIALPFEAGAAALSRLPILPVVLLASLLTGAGPHRFAAALMIGVALKTFGWIGSPVTPMEGWSPRAWGAWIVSRFPSFVVEAFVAESALSLIGIGPNLGWPTLGESVGYLIAVAPHPAWAVLLPFAWWILVLVILDLLSGVLREMRWAP